MEQNWRDGYDMSPRRLAPKCYPHVIQGVKPLVPDLSMFDLPGESSKELQPNYDIKHRNGTPREVNRKGKQTDVELCTAHARYHLPSKHQPLGCSSRHDLRCVLNEAFDIITVQKEVIKNLVNVINLHRQNHRISPPAISTSDASTQTIPCFKRHHGVQTIIGTVNKSNNVERMKNSNSTRFDFNYFTKLPLEKINKRVFFNALNPLNPKIKTVAYAEDINSNEEWSAKLGNRSESVATFGLSDSKLSNSTQEFLQRNGLLLH